MAHNQKYGQVKIKGIPDDEPVFIIRAQDKLAPNVIREYQNQARARGCTEEFADSVNSTLSAILNWQDDNEKVVKLPD